METYVLASNLATLARMEVCHLFQHPWDPPTPGVGPKRFLSDPDMQWKARGRRGAVLGSKNGDFWAPQLGRGGRPVIGSAARLARIVVHKNVVEREEVLRRARRTAKTRAILRSTKRSTK